MRFANVWLPFLLSGCVLLHHNPEEGGSSATGGGAAGGGGSSCEDGGFIHGPACPSAAFDTYVSGTGNAPLAPDINVHRGTVSPTSGSSFIVATHAGYVTIGGVSITPPVDQTSSYLLIALGPTGVTKSAVRVVAHSDENLTNSHLVATADGGAIAAFAVNGDSVTVADVNVGLDSGPVTEGTRELFVKVDKDGKLEWTLMLHTAHLRLGLLEATSEGFRIGGGVSGGVGTLTGVKRDALGQPEATDIISESDAPELFLLDYDAKGKRTNAGFIWSGQGEIDAVLELGGLRYVLGWFYSDFPKLDTSVALPPAPTKASLFAVALGPDSKVEQVLALGFEGRRARILGASDVCGGFTVLATTFDPPDAAAEFFPTGKGVSPLKVGEQSSFFARVVPAPDLAGKLDLAWVRSTTITGNVEVRGVAGSPPTLEHWLEPSAEIQSNGGMATVSATSPMTTWLSVGSDGSVTGLESWSSTTPAGLARFSLERGPCGSFLSGSLFGELSTASPGFGALASPTAPSGLLLYRPEGLTLSPP